MSNSGLRELLDSRSCCKRVIGTYLYPHVAFGDINHKNPYQATEIIKHIDVSQFEVLISRNGGLFVEPPSEFRDALEADQPDNDDFWGKVNFEQKVAKAFDRIVCELSLKSRVVSEPVTPAYISRGQLKDNHALISGGGGFQVPQDRVLKPSMDLITKGGTWSFGNQPEKAEVLDEIENLGITSQLAEIWEYLPTVISNAYSGAPKRQVVKTVVNSWLGIKQILKKIWNDYLEDVDSDKRKGILRNAGDPTKTEMLTESGVFSLELCESVHQARQNRNDIVHHDEIVPDMIKDNILALKEIIEFYSGCEVNIPQIGAGINW